MILLMYGSTPPSAADSENVLVCAVELVFSKPYQQKTGQARLLCIVPLSGPEVKFVPSS